MPEPAVEQAILNHYGVGSVEELYDVYTADFNDAVVPGFCKECGDYYGDVEPDARKYKCKNCGKPAVFSVVEIMIFGD